MAMSAAELGARIDQQQMQLQDLATQVDILNRLTSNVNTATLKQEIIETFKRAQERITALESKAVLLDQEMDKVTQNVKDTQETGCDRMSLVDGKRCLMCLTTLTSEFSVTGRERSSHSVVCDGVGSEKHCSGRRGRQLLTS